MLSLDLIYELYLVQEVKTIPKGLFHCPQFYERWAFRRISAIPSEDEIGPYAFKRRREKILDDVVKNIPELEVVVNTAQVVA